MQDIGYTNEPKIAFSPGTLHKVAGWVFDSAGVWSEFVIQYRKSTDMGLTWSDSANLSSIGSRAYEPDIAADVTAHAGRLLTAWKDEKYGCLTIVGCSVLGRYSNDAGGEFMSERRFDNRPAGVGVTVAANSGIMAVAWNDDLTDGGAMITASLDGGTTWCLPFKIDNGDIRGGIKITRNAVHIAYSKSVGGRFRVFFRRGALQPTSARESLAQRPPFATLGQNFPNPFNPTTRIVYTVGQRGPISLRIYDVLGREVSVHTEGWKEIGEYSIDWKPIGLTSGVYYYKLVLDSPTSGVIELVRKMVFVK